MISLVEHPELDWRGRVTYLLAKDEIRQLELYAMDMLWVIARKQLATDILMPSEIWADKKKDMRSGKQIMEDLYKKLVG